MKLRQARNTKVPHNHRGCSLVHFAHSRRIASRLHEYPWLGRKVSKAQANDLSVSHAHADRLKSQGATRKGQGSTELNWCAAPAMCFMVSFFTRPAPITIIRRALNAPPPLVAQSVDSHMPVAFWRSPCPNGSGGMVVALVGVACLVFGGLSDFYVEVVV